MNMLNIFEFCSGVLRHENFFCHQFKSHFGYSKVKFFCHKILFKGLTVNTNTEAITKWTTPTNLKQVLSFLSLAGYSHRFIRDYAIRLVLSSSWSMFGNGRMSIIMRLSNITTLLERICL